jgi:hypothetical protein
MPRLTCVVALTLLTASTVPALAEDKSLFDFKDDAALKAWSNLDLSAAMLKQWEAAAATAEKDGKPVPKRPATMPAQPAVKMELTESGTAGGKALMLTFDGGDWPAVTTSTIPVGGDWKELQTFKADVTVGRPCLVGFRIMQEKSRRGFGWDENISRWEKTCLLPKGKTEVVAQLHPINEYAVATKWGNVIALEIYMYHPAKGESVLIENMRLSADKMPAPPEVYFDVLGPDMRVARVGELGKRLKDKWTKPEAKTVDQIEAEFKSACEKVAKDHPKAVLAIFRQGVAGYDPAVPDKAYGGWQDTYINSHGPDGNTAEIAANYGTRDTLETFMRHRSQLIKIDVSSIPKGADILAATFVMVRASAVSTEPAKDPAKIPTMFVAEACNRPWVATEANGYEYAKDKFWKSTGGMGAESYEGDGPDFWPVYLAYGPTHGKVNTWDFTEAVKFWTEGKKPNHGFFFHGDSTDYMTAFSSKAKEAKDRPALLVIYEPK